MISEKAAARIVHFVTDWLIIAVVLRTFGLIKWSWFLILIPIWLFIGFFALAFIAVILMERHERAELFETESYGKSIGAV